MHFLKYRLQMAAICLNLTVLTLLLGPLSQTWFILDLGMGK